ncbi:hypothetical protein C427_0661 [Paraglaciecola psychrophila 170]|uniref:Uncharacterized protein n=1 Tax=Paraglaciecola psychrophila 170 TaxID=1129794 RepID=K7A2R1_9ALTE|nr:hypothetical protein C427_0661 [Paraglaciecola psychrophila 170]GAC36667.1 hypothetical protein GPSY_1029 [Paraglaciecola psychrophila 170]
MIYLINYFQRYMQHNYNLSKTDFFKWVSTILAEKVLMSLKEI